MTETRKLEDMKRSLKEKFNVTQDLQGVFFDPFAEMEDNLQKTEVEKHISTLWKFIEAKDDFKLRSIEDLLNDFGVCQTKVFALTKDNAKFATKIVSLILCHLIINIFYFDFKTSQEKLESNNDGLGSQINDLKNKNGLLLVEKVKDLHVKTFEILQRTYHCFRAIWKPRKAS